MGTAAFVALLMALCDHRSPPRNTRCSRRSPPSGRVNVGPVAGYATDPKVLGCRGDVLSPGLSWSRSQGLGRVVLRKEIERAEVAATPECPWTLPDVASLEEPAETTHIVPRAELGPTAVKDPMNSKRPRRCSATPALVGAVVPA